jgi:hypothetical protein
MKRFLVFLAAATCAASAVASMSTFTVYGTASFTNKASIDAQGDPDNILGSWIATGGGSVSALRVTGSLTEVALGTYANEARVRFTPGSGQSFTAFNYQASTVGNYTGTLAVGPTTVNVTPFTLSNGGTVGLEWFESIQDGTAGLPEQIWDNVSYEFGANVITNGGGNLGTLLGDGVTVNTPGSHVAGGLDFFTFNFNGVANASDYLNISMLGGGTGGMTDTEMAIYDSLGNFVASSDDDGPGLFSEFSYGAADPLAAPDLTPGFHGSTLAAGAYTIVTSGYNTTFGSTIGNITPGSNAGTYTLGLTYVPEPGSLALVVLAGLFAARRRS